MADDQSNVPRHPALRRDLLKASAANAGAMALTSCLAGSGEPDRFASK